MNFCKILFLSISFQFLPILFSGEIIYKPDMNTIYVKDFPLEKPCTLDKILEIDQEKKWGIINYDSATGTYTVNSHLVIGFFEGGKTYFRIGSAEHSRTKLIMKGNLVLNEPKRLRYQIYQSENGLFIGDSENNSVKPELLFDCEKPGQFGLVIGGGNILHIHNAKISALKKDMKHSFSCEIDPRMTCGNMRIINSEFSWFTSISVPCWGSKIENNLFEHGNEIRGNFLMKGCTFRFLRDGIRDHGSLIVDLVRCRFENNVCNWQLYYTPWGIIAVDCFMGKVQKEPVIRAWLDKKTQEKTFPSFISKRHIVVSVKNSEGEPIEKALVSLLCEQKDLSTVDHGYGRTDKNGKTPGIKEDNALLVTDYIVQCDRETEKPVKLSFTYELQISAPGYNAFSLKGIDPEESWFEKEVVLEK